jgi:hypothetical protein
MTQFIAHWLGDAIRLFCMLAGALLLMQAPALTHAYAVSLLQVSQDARRDIDQRQADARRHYNLPEDAGDQAVIDALRPVEPSNAVTLAQSVARAAMFTDTHSRIAAAPPLMQPITAAWDAAKAPDPAKLAVLRTSLQTYVPQVMLHTAAAIYAAVGLLVGGLIGQMLAGLTDAMAPRRV